MQIKYEFDSDHKDTICQSLAKKWRDWKCYLKKKHFDIHNIYEECLIDRDTRVDLDQWKFFINFWSSNKGKSCSIANAENRNKQKFTHVAGTKSFARIHEEFINSLYANLVNYLIFNIFK